LAAQKTVENFFGGFAIITDGQVAVGDFCRFGNGIGTAKSVVLLQSITQVLEHPTVQTGPLPVRFIGVGTYSLEWKWFAYVPDPEL
jgi:MscS family membrane protein